MPDKSSMLLLTGFILNVLFILGLVFFFFFFDSNSLSKVVGINLKNKVVKKEKSYFLVYIGGSHRKTSEKFEIIF